MGGILTGVALGWLSRPAAKAGGGLYWLAPVVLAGFAAGLGNAWVLLVEILR